MTSSVRGVCVKEWDKQEGIYTKCMKIHVYYILRNIFTNYICYVVNLELSCRKFCIYCHAVYIYIYLQKVSICTEINIFLMIFHSR